MEPMTTTVGRIHFEDFDGMEFERLVFAYLVRTRRELDLTWTGQAGQDGGRDIWGVAHNEDGGDRFFCALCANYRQLTFTKVKSDLDKVLSGKTTSPDEVLAACGGEVRARVRDRCEEYAAKQGIGRFTLWSGPDFEEYLRRDAPELLRRFFGGEPFPDAPGELAEYARYVAEPVADDAGDFEEAPAPQRLGRWRIGELLGAGGFGRVFAAEADPHETSPVSEPAGAGSEATREQAAVKIYRPRHDPVSDRRARARFSHGARVLAELGEKTADAQADGRHPNVIKLFEGPIREDGWLWLAMERVPGPSLRKAIGQVLELPLDQRLELFLGICRGLEHAHKPGSPGRFFHRDLTPENVLLDTSGDSWRPVLVDFDLARGDASRTLTLSQGLVGKAYYVPPEQAESWEGGEPDAWQRPDGEVRDLWALGMVLYFLLTGSESPYERVRAKTLAARLEGEPAERRAKVCDLVEWLLHAEPEQRPVAASEVAQKVEAILNLSPPAKVQKPLKPSGYRGWIAGVLALVITVGGAWWWSTHAPSTVPTQRARHLEQLEADAIDILQAEEVHDRGLDGEGEIVAIGSSDIDIAHPAFAERVLRLYSPGRPGTGDDPHGVGTHAAALILKAAPKAKLVVQSLLDTGGGMSGVPEDLNSLFGIPYEADRVRIQVNNWGSILGDGRYNSNSREVDEFVWQHRDMVILFSAGNEGVDRDGDGVIDLRSITPPGTAKNCITVGASESDRPSQSKSWRDGFGYPADPIASDLLADDPEGLAAISGRGPTTDGRIKPDVVAPGTSELSACSRGASVSDFWGTSSDSLYCYRGGTDVAVALVAGSAAVIRQFMVDEFQVQPSAALVKAMLINGADDLAGQYTPSEAGPIPNVNEGFGRVNLARAVSREAHQLFNFLDEASPCLTIGRVSC